MRVFVVIPVYNEGDAVRTVVDDVSRYVAAGDVVVVRLFAAVPDAQARALLDAAWDSGCRSFDTAPHYGHGLSEQRLGNALRAQPRDAFTLSSKVGRLLTPDATVPSEQHGYVGGLPFRQHWDYSAAGVRRSVEDSLRRLGLDRLDAAFVHDCDTATHGANADAVRRQVIEETLPALRTLQREGLVSAVGLGVNDAAIVQGVLREAELDVLLLAGRYSLLDHTALPELLPLCAQRGVRIALGGAFNSGLLVTGTRGGHTARFNYAPAAREWVERNARLEAIGAKHGVPLRAAALQFPLAHSAIEIVLVGARSAAEWQDAMAMARHPVPAAYWRDLRAAGLLPPDAPTP